MRFTKHCFLLAGLLTAGLILAGCNHDNSGTQAGAHNPPGQHVTDAQYDATIRITSYGIPHIKADDFGSIGYGIGYMEARDDLCVLANDYLTISGQRAQYLGRDGGYTIPANQSYANNVNSDFFWKSILTDKQLQALRKDTGPKAIAASKGFAAGYNRYLRELRAGEHPGRHAACRDADWVQPITLKDMLRRYIRLTILASSSVFPTEIATAAPPTGLGDILGLPSTQDILDALDPSALSFDNLNMGSNMYGLGPDATQNGQSMLYGNPHFPWTSTERLYQMQLTIPGQMNIFGGSLYGVPAVLIGFNRHLAWSHTVSTAYRFTFYELTLDPLDPTRYLYDGQFIPMKKKKVSIKVRNQGGGLDTLTRTMYSSRYGPMLEMSVAGIPILGWNNLLAYSLRDANLENTRIIKQFFAWNTADSLDEFIQLHKKILGVPWVNTIATGPGEPVYYGDVTVVPNVPDAKVTSCLSAVSLVFALLKPGLPVLDGSRSACNWNSDDDAPQPGIFGPSHLPTLMRDDYVANMNDSYWLTNPEEPLTGYAAIIGDEGTPRTLRTRLGIKQIQRRLDGSDGLPGTKFNVDNLEKIVLGSTIYSAELALDDVLTSVCPLDTVTGPILGTDDIGTACKVLASWDGTANLDSVGDHIWREFWRRAAQGLLPVDLPVDVPPFWLTPFSASDPVNTPRNLNVLNPILLTSLADAVSSIEAKGIPLDAPLREIQHSGVHGDNTIPIFGGLGDTTGSFTVARGNGLSKDGYAINFGNSYIQLVTWKPGCTDDCIPIAEGFVTYSQSADPASPHFADETRSYSKKQWIEYEYTEDQIMSDPNLHILHLSE